MASSWVSELGVCAVLLLVQTTQTLCWAAPSTGGRLGRDTAAILHNLDMDKASMADGLEGAKSRTFVEYNIEPIHALAKRSMEDINSRGIGGSGRLSTFWKRDNEVVLPAFSPRLSARARQMFWKRANSAFPSQNGGTQQNRLMRFWKRSEEPDQEKLMVAFLALREYLQARHAKKSKTDSTEESQSWAKAREIVDGPSGSSDLQASVQIPRQERGRQETLVRPEFNPTGW